MALIQAEVDLANIALGKIGGKQITLASCTANTRPEDVQVNLHFEQTRDSLSRSFEWPFAKTRLSLASAWVTDTDYTTDQYVWTNSLLYKCEEAHTSDDFDTDLAAIKWVLVTARPSFGYAYSYDLPADFLRLIAALENDYEADYTIESNDIFTDETEIDILYIKQETTTTNWDSLFTECFTCKLALALLNPLTGIGRGAIQVRELLLRELSQLMAQTRVIGSQEGNTSGATDWNDARY